MNVNIPVEKLKGRENFASWKFAMQAWLQLDDLWDIVTAEKVDPIKDRKALSKIILCLEPINYSHVQSAKNAKDAWNALTNAFEDSGLTRRVGLLRQLTTTRLENCKNVEEYVNSITTTAHKLSEIGFNVNDEWVGSLLLTGLPEHYRPMIMGLESSGTKITGDAIKVKLLQDVKVVEEAKNIESETAMYSNKKKTSFKCFSCNKMGHFASQCKNKGNFHNSKKNKLCKNVKNRAFLITSRNINKGWYLDSGASTHITNDQNLIKNPVDSDTTIIAANKEDFKAKLSGTVELQISGEETSTINVQETLYVPDAAANLLSVSKIVKNGHSIHFDSGGAKILDDEETLIATASEVNGIYKLDQPSAQAYLSKEKLNAEIWHRRLGHLNRKSMSLLKKMSTGIDDNLDMRETCEDCVYGKQERTPFKVSKKQSSDILELIHTDLCGPMEKESLGGAKYFMTFIDDFSRYLFIYILHNKSQALDTFKDFKRLLEKQTGKKIKKLRSDNGKEYVNHNMKNFLKHEGIEHQLTVRYTPQQNGTAERMNRSIVEKARTLLSDSGLRKEYWAEAVGTAAYLLNRSPTKRLWNKTPYEAFYGHKPEMSHLRIFGCEAMAQIPKELRKKWDPKSQKLLMMGYSETKKAYRLIDPKTKNIIFSRDVKFLETTKMKRNEKNYNENQMYVLEDTLTNISDDEHIQEDYESCSDNEESSKIKEEDINIPVVKERNMNEDGVKGHTEEGETLEFKKRPLRKIEKPAKYKDYVTYLIMKDQKIIAEPNSVENALSGPNSNNWKQAMKTELNAMIKNEVYELVKLPAEKKPLKTKWVFKEKQDKEGIKRYKARLVIKGCNQKEGIDYQETFSPVVKYSSLRYLFSLAAVKNLRIDHMDVMTAYLNGEVEEDIYVVPPEGFETNEENKVWKLKKAVYGLKQSGRCWNIKLNEVLINIGLTQCKSDPCIYTLNNNSAQILIVAIYVDDLLIFSNDKNLRVNLKKNLMSNFDMKDLGVAKNCLGMHITVDSNSNSIYLDQKEYILKILKKFNMIDCKPVNTPMEKGLDFDNFECKEDQCDVPYQEAVGSLLYLSQISRPDISYATSLLSRFNKNHNLSHWNAVKRVFRYLKGTIDLKLEYKNNSFCDIYCDSDWGNKLNDRYSVTGVCVMVNGGIVHWHSKRQKTVALSTTEAEYMALSSAVQEALWLKQLIYEISMEKVVIKVHCDNKGAIDIAKNNITSQRSKHIDIRHHFLRDHVLNKKVVLEYTCTEKMPADVFTKPLTKDKHRDYVKFLGLK